MSYLIKIIKLFDKLKLNKELLKMVNYLMGDK